MAIMDGHESTRLIRKDARFNNMPIVAMTAHAMAEDRQKCFDAGMDDYISKPIDPNRLMQILIKWIKPNEKGNTITTVAPNDEVKNNKEDNINEIGLLKELKGIDVEAGLKRVRGDMELYKKLLLDFNREFKGSCNQIKCRIESGDMETAQRIAHTIKSVAGAIGACKLFSVSGELELDIKNGFTQGHSANLDYFTTELSRVISSLNNLKEKIDAKQSVDSKLVKNEAVNIDKLKPLFVKLKALINDGDFDATEHADQILRNLNKTELYEKMKLVKQLIDDFNFDEALVNFIEISKSLGIQFQENE